MRILLLLIVAILVYFIWATIKGRPLNPFNKNVEKEDLKEKILLLLRGNEAAFLRMYEREKASYPDLEEQEILTRILYKLRNER